jgi:PmbA protein
MALELERAVLSANSLVRGVESSSYGDGSNESALVTSTGIEAAQRRTTASLGASALAGPETDTQTGYGFSVGRTLSDLDLEYAANQAANRAVRLLGATQPKTQRIPVILDPLVTRTVLALIVSALGAESVQKGRSMFAGRLGEEIGSPIVNLIEDPTNPAAFGATPFDSEGAPTRRVDLVTAGVLNGYLHNVTTARRGKTVTTGSALGSGVGARAAYLRPGPLTVEELFASVPHSLYVQSVSGIHSGTSTVSGDFSVGAEGLMVRDGVFAEPVREATIASTLPRILLDIAQIGSDLTWLPGGGAGLTLLISDMMLSGS